MNTETWKTIPGYSDYQASNLGRIRSKRPKNGPTPSGEIEGQWRVLLGSKNSRGYWKYLMVDDLGITRTVNGHVAVAGTYHGPRPTGMICRHLNDDKLDNRPDNLEWGTHAQNMQDARKNGRNPTGDNHKSSTIRAHMVHPIRQARKEGKSLKDIASMFGQGIGAISHLLHGRTWTHV